MMTGQAFGILLDTLVLAALGATIFYVLRLSKVIGAFRGHRKDMEKLIAGLSRNIDDALRAVEGLKQSGETSGKNLQKIINESKSMADELQIINEVSDGMAKRLESLIMKGKSAPHEFEINETFSFPASVSTDKVPDRKNPEKGGFFIQDRDYEGGEQVEEDFDMPEELQSQAERDLMDALRKNRKEPGRRAF
jgi:hypothetical protein